MAKPTLEDLYDYDSVIVGERENEYAETIYLHDGEWYTEEELIDELLSEDKAQIAAAGGFVRLFFKGTGSDAGEYPQGEQVQLRYEADRRP